jgi:hypothetical protein
VFAVRPLLVLLACVLLVAGCGDGGNDEPSGGSGDGGSPQQQRPVLGQRGDDEEAPADLGFPAFATKNTTRVGGADVTADAAGAALAMYPSTQRALRPKVVTLVDAGDWQAAVSAAQLLADPLGAPVLFTDGDEIPAATSAALERLAPVGAAGAGRVQVVRVGTPAKPEGLRDTNLEGSSPAALARAVDRLHADAAGGPSEAVIVASTEEPGYAMPAAAWAAKSGDPVLWVSRNDVPEATRAAIAAHGRPKIYVLGPEAVISAAVEERLAGLGEVRRIAGPDPVRTSIAFARFSDGGFGWNVVDPGHGLLFASIKRPADAAAAAAMATSGKYGPLLVVPDPRSLPRAIREYLLDIQPGYEADPVRGVYNHGWLMGDESAISLDVQARIDALLEIQPVRPDPSE